MKCPYCHFDNMPAPDTKSPRPFGKCPDCKRKSRAAISNSLDGKVYVHYSVTSLPKLNKADVKHPRSVRLSDNELVAIESGKLRLVVCNGRITVAV